MIFKNFETKNRARGFTLIELVVVVTIMLIITSVVLFNYNSFNESMLLSNFAYDMSLTIRQAQVYGVAVKEAPGLTGANQIGSNVVAHSNFQYAYGVHFSSLAANAGSFNLFVDNGNGAGGDPDGIFQSTGATTESLQTFLFSRGIKIKELCVSGGVAGTGCSSTIGGASAGTAVSNLDVTFLRPNPQAIISALPVCDPYGGNPCTRATIIIQNAAGTMKKAIMISSTGQISVQAAQ